MWYVEKQFCMGFSTPYPIPYVSHKNNSPKQAFSKSVYYISFHFPFIVLESSIYHWHHRCIVFVVLLSHKQHIKIQATCIRFLLWCMDLFSDTKNCGLRMRQECQERFTRHWLQRKPLISHLSMHHGTCVTHVPWCVSVSLTYGGGENVSVIPGACDTHNFMYLVRGPCFGAGQWSIPFKYYHQA